MYKIEFTDDPAFLRCTVKGRQDEETDVQIDEAIAQEANLSAADALLIDIRQLHGRLGLTQNAEAAGTFHQRFPPAVVKVAVLDLPEFKEQSRIFETNTRSDRLAVRFFEDQGDAESWLRGGNGAASQAPVERRFRATQRSFDGATLRYRYGENEEAWAFGLLPATTSVEDFGHFAPLVALWGRCGYAVAEGCARFLDPITLADWLGFVSIDEVTYDPFDMHCKLFGTTLVDLYGEDQTGKSLSSYLGDPLERPYYGPYLEFHQNAADEFAVVRTLGSLIHKGRAVGVEWIGLPCAVSENKVSHFLSAARSMPLTDLNSAITELRSAASHLNKAEH